MAKENILKITHFFSAQTNSNITLHRYNVVVFDHNVVLCLAVLDPSIFDFSHGRKKNALSNIVFNK